MLIGLVGIVLPVLPGIGLMWLAVLVYALFDRFATIDAATFAVLTLLAVLGLSADLWMSQLGARTGGASGWTLVIGVITGVIGAIVGLVFLGIGAIPGAIVGALLGVTLAEWYRYQNWRKALKAAGGWLGGCALSWGVRIVIGVLMILIFTWQALKG